jgi:hypothetical protein
VLFFGVDRVEDGCRVERGADNNYPTMF